MIELLLVTTVPAMILADEGLPSLGLIAAVLVGGALAAGGANTVNCWIERDRDQMMKRTRHRPLATGAVEPVPALVFGLVLEVLAFRAALVDREPARRVVGACSRCSSTSSCTRSGSSPGARRTS